ncbi:hypothetical protein HD554DRAFT_2170928 [Boletus coccyginus]|nr:hypothetical protein HD554DRAFT_2170928 [Boletus coccyginus]
MPVKATKKPKRRRLARDDQANSSTASPPVFLTTLPFEILAEILLDTCSPPTVLAVSRTCSFLYRLLAQNPSASFIWRGVRKICAPVPLPDPGDGWRKSEADYAAFVFGGGVCEVCRKTTRAMYTSFSAQIRLCGNMHCRRRFFRKSIIDLSSLDSVRRLILWVPPVESGRCFFPSTVNASIWPQIDSPFLIRKSDWAKFEHELCAYECAQVQTCLSTAVEEEWEVEGVRERCDAAMKRFPQIMDVSTRLIRWKWAYDEEYTRIKRENETWTKGLAEREGWDLNDLVATHAYGSLQRCKNYLLEEIGSNGK